MLSRSYENPRGGSGKTASALLLATDLADSSVSDKNTSPYPRT